MPINKREGESRDEFVSRCVKKEMDSGMPQDQALAVCLTYADENFSIELADSYTDYPEAAKENAKVALRWADENGWGDCGTPVGKARANQLANGEAISRDTIARMAAFERHRQNSQKELGDGCGRLMWLAWGGDEGIAWAQRKLQQIDGLKTATASVTDNTWSTEAPININFEKISIDYDDTLSTSKGKALAKILIADGNDVYIISARSSKLGMLSVAKELGIPESRVYATGSNKAKAEKVKELGIKRHIDNNSDVVKSLPGIGEKFGKVKKILFEEDFDELEMAIWKEMGFKILVRSKRKIKKQDKKVWNKLKSAGLSEDNLVFGEVEELDKKYNFDMIFNGDDPLLTLLSMRGKPADYTKYLASKEVNSIEEALEFQKEFYKNSDLRFATLKTVFVYEEIPGIPATKGSSRPFCQKMMASRREYTVQEIQDINNSHLVKMFSKYPGLEPSVLLYRGGFYRNPDTGNITAWCRHQWTAKVAYA